MNPSSNSRRSGSRVRPDPNFTSAQPDLFQQLEQPAPPPADLDIHFELLGAITCALRDAKRRGLSRERIVDAMNRLLPEVHGEDGRPAISKRQLDAWTAASQEYKEFPARYLPALCAATDSDLPLRRLAQAIGMDLVDEREGIAKQLGEMQVEAARLRREARTLVKQLGDEP